MKKIKLITTLSSLATVATVTPIVATSCSDTKSLTLKLFNYSTETSNEITVKPNTGNYLILFVIPNGMNLAEQSLFNYESKLTSIKCTSSNETSFEITRTYGEYPTQIEVDYWCHEGAKEELVTLDIEVEMSSKYRSNDWQTYKGSTKIDVNIQNHNYVINGDTNIFDTIDPDALVLDYNASTEAGIVTVKNASVVSYDETLLKEVKYDSTNKKFTVSQQSGLPAGIHTNVEVQFEVEIKEGDKTIEKTLDYSYYYTTVSE
ncbi:MAG: hypothetical protein HUJ52_00630 [Malacoplasma sp.]|nr:hypothetical protein [Malacoplasma sp.]